MSPANPGIDSCPCKQQTRCSHIEILQFADSLQS